MAYYCFRFFKSNALRCLSVICNWLCYRKSHSCHRDVHVFYISPNAPFLYVFGVISAFCMTSAVIQIPMEIQSMHWNSQTDCCYDLWIKSKVFVMLMALLGFSAKINIERNLVFKAHICDVQWVMLKILHTYTVRLQNNNTAPLHIYSWLLRPCNWLLILDGALCLSAVYSVKVLCVEHVEIVSSHVSSYML